jgi:hypothetical protein
MWQTWVECVGRASLTLFSEPRLLHAASEAMPMNLLKFNVA